MQHCQNCFLLGLALVLITCLACSDDDRRTNPRPPSDHISVTGQVYIWNCWPGDSYHNPSDRDYYRFGYRTGSTATVYFTDTVSGNVVSAICDSAGFTASLDTGVYSVVVETKYTFPDTFTTIEIEEDGALDLDIVYDWYTADSLLGTFVWDPSADTIGEDAERKILDSISVLFGPGMIKADEAVRSVQFSFDSGWLYSTYTVPIGDSMKMWQVAQRSLDIIQSYYGDFPGIFTAIPDFRPCMDDLSRRAAVAIRQ